MLRRAFLATPALGWAARSSRKIDFSRISAITDEIATTEQESIEFAQKYGMKWLELRQVPVSGRAGSKGYHALPEAELKAAAQRFADAGIRISFLNTPFFKSWLPGTEPLNFAKMTPEQRARAIARDQKQYENRAADIRQACNAAHILGVDKIRVFSFLRTAEPESVFPRVAEVINEMAAIAAKEKIQLLVENENACNAVSCAEMAKLMKLMPARNIGINWDPMNGAAMKEDPYPTGYALLPAKRVRNVQIKGRSLLDYPQKLDWAAIFHGLEKDGYEGIVGVETHIFGPQLIEHSHSCIQKLKSMLS
jgi:sugar phosphate isomerase/epimerase